jgi:MauM/NapG family ferredoxin protein
VQGLGLLGFLWLFLQTEYRGADTLRYPVSLLFRIDPLAALADALAPGDFSWSRLWPALVLLVLTALFGRFFCGWICPLGATLDGVGKVVGRGGVTSKPGWRRSKYYLLLGLTAASLGGVQLLGIFDPLSIFLRSLTVSLNPALNLVANGTFDFFYAHSIPLISSAVNGSYDFFRDHLLSFHPPAYQLALFTFAVFLLILLLERVERRFWCKNLCPLGALLGLCSRRSLVVRTPAQACSDCRRCVAECRSGAVSPVGHNQDECLLCFDCAGFCPSQRVVFSLGARSATAPGVDLTRRGVVTSLAAGLVAVPVMRSAPDLWNRDPWLLRPPGSLAETEFLRRCIRCGECMKVCIGGALHPALAQAGAGGLWTPLLVPRIGYCEYNCTLCGQVCPTGAIRLLNLEEKHKAVIGIAVFDKNRCLPFARGEECLVCEEHCPTGEKAIVFDERDIQFAGEIRRVKMPRVVKQRCVGCGICETRCPLEGASAIRVLNEGESRRQRDFWI